MKRTGAIICIAAAFAACGAALAQELPDDGRFVPFWIERPDGHTFARAYPPAALNGGVEGTGVLCCTPREDRRLSCRVGVEWPEGYGFGIAAQRVAGDFKLSDESYAAFRSDPANWMQVPIVFRLGDVDSRAVDKALAEIRATTQGLCRPRAAPISAIAPASVSAD